MTFYYLGKICLKFFIGIILIQVILLALFYIHTKHRFVVLNNITASNAMCQPSWSYVYNEEDAVNGEPCSPNISKPVGVNYYKQYISSIETLDTLKQVKPGGVWRPANCVAPEKLVLIIPYRNRSENLIFFLTYMHNFLQHQILDYRIIIVEQSGQAPFNRGMLMNIGFTEVTRLQKVDCAIFHDVDLLPENDLNLYKCDHAPIHMSASISKYDYRLPYESYFGGVEAFQSQHFKLINGYSNVYFGWGAEDDDLHERVKFEKLNVLRYTSNVTRYKALVHNEQEKNSLRMKLLNESSTRYKTDGLNSLDYKCLKMIIKLFFTHILVDLDEYFNKMNYKINVGTHH